MAGGIPLKMELVQKGPDDYDFYISADGTLYNIVPTGQKAPAGGYRSVGYIEHIKHVKFPEKYLPNKDSLKNWIAKNKDIKESDNMSSYCEYTKPTDNGSELCSIDQKICSKFFKNREENVCDRRIQMNANTSKKTKNESSDSILDRIDNVLKTKTIKEDEDLEPKPKYEIHNVSVDINTSSRAFEENESGELVSILKDLVENKLKPEGNLTKGEFVLRDMNGNIVGKFMVK
jgi:hypothetical protein